MIAGILLFVVCALGALGVAAFAVKRCFEVLKPVIKIDYVDFLKKNALLTGAFALLLTGMFFFIYLWAGITPTVRDVLSTLFGGLFFSYLLLASLQLFMIHYYGKDIPEEIDKWLFRGLCIAFPLVFVFVFLLSDGFADYMNLNEPLVNGIYFIDGFGWSRPGTYGHSTNIAFYAICILSGALYVYFICDHKMYKLYGKHGILESTLLVALPAGIIGARLWYVIGNWEREFAHTENPFLSALDMTKGGLTILGGAIMGILVGALWFKYISRGTNFRTMRRH